MYAYHMHSKNGGLSGAHIIIIDNDNVKWFQSYQMVVAKYEPLVNGYKVLNQNFTRTTTNYLTSFIKLCSHQIVANIEDIGNLENVEFVDAL